MTKKCPIDLKERCLENHRHSDEYIEWLKAIVAAKKEQRLAALEDSNGR